MWSMWDAPSDRDYYGQWEPPEEPERCLDCGAREDQACEEWCSSSRPASEPAEAEAECYGDQRKGSASSRPLTGPRCMREVA